MDSATGPENDCRANMRLGSLRSVHRRVAARRRKDPTEHAITAEPARRPRQLPHRRRRSPPAPQAIRSMKLRRAERRRIAVGCYGRGRSQRRAGDRRTGAGHSRSETSVSFVAGASPRQTTRWISRRRDTASKTKAINLRAKVAVKNSRTTCWKGSRVSTQHGQRRSPTYDVPTIAVPRAAFVAPRVRSPLARDIDRSRAAIWDVLAIRESSARPSAGRSLTRPRRRPGRETGADDGLSIGRSAMLRCMTPVRLTRHVSKPISHASGSALRNTATIVV